MPQVKTIDYYQQYTTSTATCIELNKSIFQ